MEPSCPGTIRGTYFNEYDSLQISTEVTDLLPQEHALIPHKGARFEPPYTGVTLACTRDEEAVSDDFPSLFFRVPH